MDEIRARLPHNLLRIPDNTPAHLARRPLEASPAI
jgi:hypothetical protein